MQPGDIVICIDDSIKADKIEFVSAAYPNWIKEGRKQTLQEAKEGAGNYLIKKGGSHA